MKKLGFLITMLVITSLPAWSQGAKSIRITEVMTDNRTNLVDEYGQHKPWVELSNSSFTTYNVRGMFLTTDRRVLNKNLSPEARRQLMCPLPNNEPRTTLAGKKSVIIYDRYIWHEDSEEICPDCFPKGRGHFRWLSEGTGPFQLKLGLVPLKNIADAFHEKNNWIALYDGNAVDLIDSISIPWLAADQSYALNSDFKTWKICKADEVTPGYLPQRTGLSKSQVLKKTDPHGYGIAILSMGIVFSCLALLFIFFWAFGAYMKHKQRIARATEKHATLLYKTGKKTIEVTQDLSHKTNVILKDGLETKGIDKEIYMAVISLALQEYLEDVHDVESGIITIKPKQTRWNAPKFNNNNNNVKI